MATEFSTLQRALARSGALTDVSEAHGVLAGALCAATDYAFDDWLTELYAEGSVEDDDARDSLRAVFQQTREALHEPDSAFGIYLPDDEEPLGRRATALGEWCQGFLYGLGTNQIPNVDQLPDDLAEVVRDLSAITQIAVDETATDEDNEQAYAELVEFVRVGAQIVFTGLAPFRIPRRPEGQPSEGSLH